MKLYVQEHLWAGVIIVIATSEFDAREKMCKYHNYDSFGEVLEYEIDENFEYANYGDL